MRLDSKAQDSEKIKTLTKILEKKGITIDMKVKMKRKNRQTGEKTYAYVDENDPS